jgi:hypothetical protein
MTTDNQLKPTQDDRCPTCGAGAIFWDARHHRAHGNAERESGAGPTGWLPIDSAPQTGETILAICASAYTPTAFDTWWADGWTHYSRPDDKWHGGVGKWFPTHWMPREAYIAALSQPSPDEETCRCDDCGRANPVWFAPSPLWNLVVGGPDATDDPGGIVCPICFIEKAEAAGIMPSDGAWLLTNEAPSPLYVLSASGAAIEQGAAEQIDKALFNRFRGALAFAASRSALTSDEEKRLLSAVSALTDQSQAERLREALTEIEHAESVEIARHLARAALSETRP